MFNDQNQVLQRATRQRADIFASLRTEQGARDAARSGWWATALMAALTLFGAFMTMRIPGINSDAATILLAVSVGVAAVLAALAGIIRTWQPRWATVVLLLWLAFNFLATLVTAPVSLGMILSAAATAVAARATIGAFKAAQFKRNAPRVPDVPAVFD